MINSELSTKDSEFITYLRSLSILVIVFGHVGGFWIYRPYSEFLHIFVPLFFFLSGAVNFYSYRKGKSLLKYYQKRFVGLLVPYYLICLLSLLVFIVINKRLPEFNLANLILWLQIGARLELMPFSIAQVWFLHALFFVILFSPFYFLLYEKDLKYIYLLLVFLLILSTFPFWLTIKDYFYLLGNDLFKPLIFSLFFIFGMVYFSTDIFRKTGKLVIIILTALGLSIIIVKIYNIDIDFGNYIHPNIYTVLVSLAAICVILLSQKQLRQIVKSYTIIENIFKFFHKHTFSIFLLHSFAIYLSENVFGLINPEHKNIAYGLKKLVLVLILTSLFSLPFTALSNYLIKKLS